MSFHVTKHVLVSISLRQQFLQMNVHMREYRISISWCHVTRSLPGQLLILTDSTQLIKSVLILKLFVALLQIVYHPPSSLQINIQRVNLGLLLLDDLFQFRATRARININQCKFSILAS